MTEEIKDLKRILELGDPILFLGSGFSLGAKTQSGKDFPTGKQLKEELIVDLLQMPKGSDEFNELFGYSLSEVCDFSENEKSKDHLTDYLVNHFKNSRPAMYHDLISNFPWKKIYTTNIDDVVETSYANKEKRLLIQNHHRRSTLKANGDTEYIKLHGCVNNPAEGLTFSIKSYLDTMITTKDYRFNSLSLDMHSEAIIFVGHDFNEINIDYYLKLYENSGYQSSRGKLIFINPYPSVIFKSKVKAIGASIIKWNTQEFLEFVNKTHSESDNSHNVKSLKSLKRFGFSRLNDIRKATLPVKNYESNLFFGFEPQWKDIFDEWDFENREIKKGLDNFILDLKAGESGIFSIYGKGLSGKSTFLLRLGLELSNEGFEVWQYNGKYFNYFELFKWIKYNKEKKNFVLLYDNASPTYRDISKLVNLIPQGQQLIVITTARLPLHIRMRYNIVEDKLVEYYIEPKITEEYATVIEGKLNQKGYLGTLKKFDEDKRIRTILQKNDVLEVLFEITYGKGFRNRLNKNIEPKLQRKSDGHDLLILLAMFDKLDIPYLPKELVTMLYGVKAKTILNQVEDFIKYSQSGDLSLRTGFFLISILKSASRKKIISILKQVLKLIAPQIDNNPRNLWNQIEAVCIKEKLLRKRLKLETNQIKEMLYDLKDDLSASYNYWIQLGISEQFQQDYEKALNHFRQAEIMNPGSYMVQNAIGRNFLKQANSLKNYTEAEKIFEEGESILLKLINNREEFQVRAFSTHTYLYEKVNFLKKFKPKISNSELRRLHQLLQGIIDKDPEDVMTKHIGNYFFSFLKQINKTSIVKLKYHDLSMLKPLMEETNIEFDDFSPE